MYRTKSSSNVSFVFCLPKMPDPDWSMAVASTKISSFTFSLPFYLSVVPNVVLSLKTKKLNHLPSYSGGNFFTYNFVILTTLSGLDHELKLYIQWVVGRCWEIRPLILFEYPASLCLRQFCLIQRRVEFCPSVGKRYVLRNFKITGALNMKPQAPRPESPIFQASLLTEPSLSLTDSSHICPFANEL